MDTIACGAIPVVPNFPVLASQVLEPAPIGEVYDSLLTIPDVLNKVKLSLPILLDNQKRYKAERACIEIKA